jgi:hypothetical protein
MNLKMSCALLAAGLAVALAGCSQRSEEADRTSVPSEPNPSARPDAGTKAPADVTLAEKAPPPPEPVDLLRATRTDLAVSSAYRKNQVQAERLVDGELDSAWNSQSGDLVGAWIDVRLPAEASVTSIAMTAGFTKNADGNDLFVKNQRISKVRVLREGQEVGTFDLDIENRGLQTLPVTGGGGVYRIEIAAVVAGSQASWTEACVSELRVFGQAPGALEGERIPRFGIGALPEPRPDPGTGDRAKVLALFSERKARLTSEWSALAQEQEYRSGSSALEEDQIASTEAFAQRRLKLFEGLAEVVDLVDDVQADRIRLGSRKQVGPASSWTIVRSGDLDLYLGGMDTVVSWLSDRETSCNWAKTSMGLRLRQLEDEIRGVDFACEHASMDSPGEEPSAADVSRCNTSEKLLPTIAKLRSTARGDFDGALTKIGALEVPPISKALTDQWDAIRSQAKAARSSCGSE